MCLFTRRFTALFAPALLLALLAPPARAGASDRENRPGEDGAAYETRRYAGYTLAADAVGFGLFALGAAAEGEDGRDTEASVLLMNAGMSAMLLGGPIVHAARGHWQKAGGSLGLRLGLAAIGMTIGYAAASSSCDRDGSLSDAFCGLEGVGPGWLAGAATASILDATLLAKERVQVEAAPVIVPVLSAGPSGGTLGVAATF